MTPETAITLPWKKFPIGTDGFVCLVDCMGDDSAIVQAAKISFNKDNHEYDSLVFAALHKLYPALAEERRDDIDEWSPEEWAAAVAEVTKDENTLLRYLMRHQHGTPLEMAEVKLMIQIPMDAWRQFVRHRTLNINESSTRYTEAIDSMAKTPPDEWRLQSSNNKQGSVGLLTEWPEGYEPGIGYVNLGGDLSVGVIPEEYRYPGNSPGEYLAAREAELQTLSASIYQERLKFGIAREQARKDLPLSTYTRAIVKCDIRNWLHFLGLRMDSHAQKEIRDYATVIGEQIIKPLFPLTWQAFVDYRLEAMTLSRLEIELIRKVGLGTPSAVEVEKLAEEIIPNKRERQEAMSKLLRLDMIYEPDA